MWNSHLRATNQPAQPSSEPTSDAAATAERGHPTALPGSQPARIAGTRGLAHGRDRWWSLPFRYGRLSIAALLLLLVGGAALLAPVLAIQAPETQHVWMRLAPPGSAYLLGGDTLGRDVLTRLMYAGRVSLLVALISMVITIVVGVAVGAIAGYVGGWVDRLLMRLTDLVLIFPTFFLLVFAVATFGRSVSLLILIIGLTSWPANARVVRGLMLKLRQQEFVTAAQVVGVGHSRIIWRHLVPHAIPIILASATIRVANNILIESGLSYIGLGIAQPTPSWGNMIAEGLSFVRSAWWLVTFPGIAIFAVVLAFNLLGEGLRDLLSPAGRSR